MANNSVLFEMLFVHSTSTEVGSICKFNRLSVLYAKDEKGIPGKLVLDPKHKVINDADDYLHHLKDAPVPHPPRLAA